jgi:transposase
MSPESSVCHVGLDVHKDTIAVATYRGWSPEPHDERTLPHDLVKLRRYLLRLGGPVHACYEAGPCGYGVQRMLAEAGVECVVVAPSLIPVRAGDRCKTDRRDARKLARLLRAGELTPVRVPSEREEQDRELVRCREVLKRELHRSKQYVGKLLLCRGVRFPGPGKSWSQAYRRWLRRLELGGHDQDALRAHLALLDTKQGLLDTLDEQLEALASKERYAAVTGRLRCLRGIDTLSAITLSVEIGDARRFARARHLMGYVGLGIREHSSGERQRRGAITKTGNAACRRVLVEAAWHCRHTPYVSEALRKRQCGQRPDVVAHAQRAQRRLHRRFRSLSARVEPCKAVTATARELTGYVWALMRAEPELLTAGR